MEGRVRAVWLKRKAQRKVFSTTKRLKWSKLPQTLASQVSCARENLAKPGQRPWGADKEANEKFCSEVR
jgi:hypothetical protein